MSKKVFFLIILLLIQLELFPSPVFAISSCKDSQIDWDPKIFLEGQTNYVINFSIRTNEAFANIVSTSPYVRLLADRGIFDWGGTFTPPIKIEDPKFSFVLTGSLTTRNIHNGVLQWSATENGNYQDLCSNIVYQVGAVGHCTVLGQSVPDKIPLNTELRVKFVGKPDTDYKLRIGGNAIIQSIKTDNGGQGEFPSVVIPGKNGETIRLNVTAANIGQNDTGSCFKDTKIDINAPSPAPVPSGSVQPGPANPVVKQCPNKDEQFNPAIHIDPAECIYAGGIVVKGCTDNPNNPAIATAIGCIHTSPAALMKDLLTFAIGISGGLAFLMMLLGAFQMLTSAGNPETLQAGKDRLTSAVIGLLFIIFSVLLLQIIGVDILGIPGFGR